MTHMFHQIDFRANKVSSKFEPLSFFWASNLDVEIDMDLVRLDAIGSC